jgi:hypothetical protein
MVEPYIEKHMNFVRSENSRKNEAWITRHHMETFGDWLHKKCQGDKTIGDELYLLARQPAWHVLTYKGYEINENTFTPYLKIKRVPTKTVVSAWMLWNRMGT